MSSGNWLSHRKGLSLRIGLARLEAVIEAAEEDAFEVAWAEGESITLEQVTAEILSEDNYVAPLAQLMVGTARPIQAVLEAFRDGGGVPFSEYAPRSPRPPLATSRALSTAESSPSWVSRTLARRSVPRT